MLIFANIELSTPQIVKIFFLSCLFMMLDFIVLKYNPLIYLHHVFLIAMCVAYYIFSTSHLYEDSEFMSAYIEWGILVTNISWIKRLGFKRLQLVYASFLAYAFLNIIAVSIFAYHFSKYFVPIPSYYVFTVLGVVSIFLSYYISNP